MSKLTRQRTSSDRTSSRWGIQGMSFHSLSIGGESAPCQHGRRNLQFAIYQHEIQCSGSKVTLNSAIEGDLHTYDLLPFPIFPHPVRAGLYPAAAVRPARLGTSPAPPRPINSR